MKIADVKIGAVYLTRICGALHRVIVVRAKEPDGRFDKVTRFYVRREGETALLPKARTASALRPAPPHITDARREHNREVRAKLAEILDAPTRRTLVETAPDAREIVTMSEMLNALDTPAQAYEKRRDEALAPTHEFGACRVCERKDVLVVRHGAHAGCLTLHDNPQGIACDGGLQWRKRDSFGLRDPTIAEQHDALVHSDGSECKDGCDAGPCPGGEEALAKLLRGD